jgi:hypothetical protein
MTNEELSKKKYALLRKIRRLETKGVEFSQSYNMSSSLAEMDGEYNSIIDEKAKVNSVKFQGSVLLNMVQAVEYLNSEYDPFDINLDGMGEQINDNINDYDDIFAELHDKYSTDSGMAPELKLLFQVGSAAMSVHLTNSLFKTSAAPDMEEVFRQNPDMRREFQTAAINSMSQTAPGMTSFMNMGRNMGEQPPPMREQYNAPPPPIHTKHHEMRGPSDISDILSGLKEKPTTFDQQQPHQFQTKRVQSPPAQPKSSRKTAPPKEIEQVEILKNDSSTMSIGDMKSSASLSKSSHRKKKGGTSRSANIISLDL